MEETNKLIDVINDLTCMLDGEFSDYEAHDIAIKILALQEQRKQSISLDMIETRLLNIGMTL